ncbi:hypothetical protein [Xanthomonas arboricola]|uniref:hypothetical protein n=1 Tax=Xanthomonas arboricola TaxID=56448 RepID=UPI003CF2E0D9
MPDISAISPSALVSFPTRRLRGAAVVWMNNGWFLEKGIDLTTPSTYDRVADWLVNEFAFCVYGDRGHIADFDATKKEFYADRYGTTEGTSPHGGSGRVGISGQFQVKGIGITPLVGSGAHVDHSHGALSLQEAILEAVYSEIAAREFPFGAIPVIAVLDTGFGEDLDGSGKHIRRALLIRPLAIRAAHAERAPLFLRSVRGFANSQKEDANRVRQISEAWSRGFDSRALASLDPLKFFISRVVQQIAFTNVHRFFSGGFFSSNVSVSGEIIDFGNMHVLPDWGSAEVAGGAVMFGTEQVLFKRIIRSITFSFLKYAIPDLFSEFADICAKMQAYADKQFTKYFRRECLSIFSLNEHDQASEEIFSIISSFLSNERRIRTYYAFGRLESIALTKIPYESLPQELSSWSLDTYEMQVFIRCGANKQGDKRFNLQAECGASVS